MRSEEEKEERRRKGEEARKSYQVFYSSNPGLIQECRLCRTSKELRHFVGNYHHRFKCKECHKDKVKKQRQDNRDQVIEAVRRGSRKSGAFVQSLKLSKPCSRCSNSFPPEAMDFHHLGDKFWTVSKLYGKSERRILEEVAKCVLLCANCHRDETQNESRGPHVLKNRKTGPEHVDTPIRDGDETKGCRRCLKIKHVNDFPMMWNGYRHSYCIPCKREYERELPKRTSEASRESERVKDRQPCHDCGRSFRYWQNVCRGKSLTCGCASNHVSRAQREIARFIEGLGFKVLTEHRIRSLKYDVFIPERNLVLEYHGLKWHVASDSRSRDLRKYEVAVDSGLQFISIFEDEWVDGREKVENLLRNRLVKGKPRTLRPSQCEIVPVTGPETASFYDAHHYLGRCNAKAHYGVRFEGRLIAAASFSVPTRQSKHPWELVRMASDPGFRVHGVWSKILSRFVREHSPSSIVSFSDKRLFGGGVYETIGFRKDGDVPPDYYWVKGGRRFNKSGLRKRDEERGSGRTESELREAEGYRKVWDLGKVRWVWTPGMLT